MVKWIWIRETQEEYCIYSNHTFSKCDKRDYSYTEL